MTDTRELVEKLCETALLFEKALALKSRDVCLDAADTITALSERNRVLEEALQFYADTGKYPAPLTGGCGDLYFDCGQVARAALTSEGRG